MFPSPRLNEVVCRSANGRQLLGTGLRTPREATASTPRGCPICPMQRAFVWEAEALPQRPFPALGEDEARMRRWLAPLTGARCGMRRLSGAPLLHRAELVLC